MATRRPLVPGKLKAATTETIEIPEEISIEPTLSIDEEIEFNKANLSPSLTLDSHKGNAAREFPELPEALFELNHLKELTINRFNLFGGLERLSDLSNLESLTIDTCVTDGFPSGLDKLPKLSRLSFESQYTIEKLPRSLTKLKNINYLFLGRYNKISSIEGLPPNLNYLGLSVDNLQQIPEIIFNLEFLTKLFLSHVSTQTIPASIGKLKHLASLFITDSTISSLPNELANLKNLKELSLYRNSLHELPSIVSKLKGLRRLILSSNLLNTLPDFISELTELVNLDLRVNIFQEIPKPVFSLTKLKKLDLANTETSKPHHRNCITHIPDDFLKLENLVDFLLDKRDATNVPAEIIAQGAEAIRSYLFQLKEQEKDYLFEAKLLILGEPDAGKTTLTRKFLDPNCPLPKPNEPTLGVDVRQLFFPVNADDFPEAIKPGESRNFRLNIWDFGGQEIYKSTHRFFLSERAVYVLVADGRRQNTDFAYWLHIEEIFGGKSPVVIVVNEINSLTWEVDETDLKGHFVNIKDVLFVDLNEPNKQRLTRIRSLARTLAVALPHIGSPVPATWTAIRDALENDPRNHIPTEEYLALCRAHGIANRNDALVLSRYFHDIGVFLHFQEDELLDDHIFLKPTWATNAVYRVLNAPLLKEQDGRFSRKQALEIWQDDEFANIRNELLRLMQNFFLTYKVSDSEGYIVPEKLPSSRPTYEWDETNNLVLEYHYKHFMPKGLLTQFIVQQHRYIKDNTLVWLRGAVLRWHEAEAEVTEVYSSRIIRVRIVGKHRRDFMTILMEALDGINEQYKNLKVEKSVPCPCEQCAASKAPATFEFSDLKARLEHNEENIQCRKSYQQLNVAALLHEVVNPGLLTADKNSEFAKMMHAKNAENASSTGKIFISYAHEDEAYLNRLLTHFKVLEHEGVKVEAWSDKKLVAGVRWRDEIERSMQDCQVAILLVSTDFLASDFIRTNELPTLLKAAETRGVTLLSVIVSPCRYNNTEFLKDYQAINGPDHPLSSLSHDEREKVYLKVLSRVEELLPAS